MLKKVVCANKNGAKQTPRLKQLKNVVEEHRSSVLSGKYVARRMHNINIVAYMAKSEGSIFFFFPPDAQIDVITDCVRYYYGLLRIRI